MLSVPIWLIICTLGLGVLIVHANIYLSFWLHKLEERVLECEIVLAAMAEEEEDAEDLSADSDWDT